MIVAHQVNLVVVCSYRRASYVSSWLVLFAHVLVQWWPVLLYKHTCVCCVWLLVWVPFGRVCTSTLAFACMIMFAVTRLADCVCVRMRCHAMPLCL